jgi:replicative DNA helicase
MTVTFDRALTTLDQPPGLPAGIEPSYRQPPHNLEAEQGLLGAVLINNRAHEKVSEFLRPIHFYDPAHARIFEAIQKKIDRNEIANPVTLRNYFQHDQDLAEIGGADYLNELAVGVAGIFNVEDYGRTIHDLYLRRELIELGETVVNENYVPEFDVTAKEQIEQTEQRLYELATVGDFKGSFVDFKTALGKALGMAQDAYRRDSHISGITTGLTDIDRKLGGLHPSDLLILAGRPSMGKTALATAIAFNAAKAYLKSGGRDGGKVGFFSLEMSAEQLATRILSEQSEVASEKIRRGDLRQEDFSSFAKASADLERLPFFIDDTPALTISALRTRARRLKRQQGLDMLVIDYLQLLSGGAGMRNNENRVQEVSMITRGLKAIAKELDIPVVALSQLSRAVEQREDKRPQLADLRESGSIEQDADVVMFVYREQYYLERAEPGRRADEEEGVFNERHAKWMKRCEEVHNTAEVVVSKQRHGPIGTVRLFFDGQLTRFANLNTTHVGG